jgi:hypothetical protein
MHSTLIALVLAGSASCSHLRPPPADVALTSATLSAPQLRREILETTPPLPHVALTEWPSAYPDAARELDAWMRQYPSGASALSRWAEAHPEQAYALLMWSVSDRNEDVDSMLLTRWDWDAFRDIEAKEHDAVESFVAWARRAPFAAVSLAPYADGLSTLRRARSKSAYRSER